jgi:hypothetical protein
MIDFPANPTVGQIFTAAAVTWTWDGVKWTGSAGSGATVIAASTPPVNPTLGTLWWDTTGGQLYVWYNDGNSTQWVIAVNYGFGTFLPLVGGTLTGPLVLVGDPTAALQPTTKQYVDNKPYNDNRIINGDMLFDQRAGTGRVTNVSNFVADRWYYGANQAGKLTWAQASSVAMTANGFPWCTTFTSSSAYVSLANDAFAFYQAIEADFVSDFCWGTANARPVTLSFWVNVSIAGTYSGCVSNYGGSRSYPFSFAIPTGWSKVVINIPGDTAGTWVMSGNGGALYVTFDLGSGINFRGPANGTWQNGNWNGAVGAASLVATNGAIFQLTGVKLEVGNVATPFNRQTLAKKLADCQRYYQQYANILTSGYNGSGGAIITEMMLTTTMRATPTMTPYALTYSNSSAFSANVIVADSIRLQVVISVTGFGWGASVPFALSAEL